MVRDGRAIDDESPPESLHDLRKRGKELRYLLELFGSLFPPSVVKPMVSALKGLQDVLDAFRIARSRPSRCAGSGTSSSRSRAVRRR